MPPLHGRGIENAYKDAGVPSDQVLAGSLGIEEIVTNYGISKSKAYRLAKKEGREVVKTAIQSLTTR